MRKNLEISRRLYKNLKVEATKNDTLLQTLAAEVLEHYLEKDVPVITPDTDTVKRQLTVDETLWEQVRALAHKNGVGIYLAFESAAVDLGYGVPSNR